MSKSTLRKRADKIKADRCKNLICVLENPKTIENVGSVIRNAEALGVEKVYVVDTFKLLPKTWEEMRDRKRLNNISVSAIRWKYVKTFEDTQSCIDYLKKNKYVSVVTSPHVKGKSNVVLHEGTYTHKKLAVWFGNESKGISDVAVDNSDLCVNIPMYGIIESLNLGTCSGIVMYEITKQRRKLSKKN